MDPENDPAQVEQEQADLAAGFGGEEKPIRPEKPIPAEPPREEAPAPKYVQITEADWADVRAAAARTASYERQLSSAHGSIGNLQKTVNELRAATPRGIKVEIPKDAFDDLEKEFPELAAMNRAALEKALSGITGTEPRSEFSEADLARMVSERTTKLEVEALEDAHPEWRKIVGAVDIRKEQPDPNNAFRKWLGAKDATYQARLNNTESAAVISRAITLFQRETKAGPKPGPNAADRRREIVQGAVQPRGDGGAPAAGSSAQDEFEAGFKSR